MGPSDVRAAAKRSPGSVGRVYAVLGFVVVCVCIVLMLVSIIDN